MEKPSPVPLESSTLQPGDVLVLKEKLKKGWWVVSINGETRVLNLVESFEKKKGGGGGGNTLSNRSSPKKPELLELRDVRDGRKSEDLSNRENRKSMNPFARHHKKKKTKDEDESDLISSLDNSLVMTRKVELVKDQLKDLEVELELCLRAYNEDASTQMLRNNQALIYRLSPQEQRLMELEGFKHNYFLSPARELRFREIVLAGPEVKKIDFSIISDEQRAKLKTREFDILPIKDADDEHLLYLLVMEMFRELGLIEEFNLSTATLYRFLLTVSRRYRDVPFHSFYHAFNVTQTMYYLLINNNDGRYPPIHTFFRPLEVFALMVSALCHDIDHPGLNNDFQRKAQTALTVNFNKSFLENHHLGVARSILNKRECDIWKTLSTTDQLEISVLLERCIMATDLAFGAQILSDWNSRKSSLKSSVKRRKELSESDRRQAMLVLMKCADLSNEIRPQEVAERWAKKVISEFLGQTRLEKENGFEVAAWMDGEKIILPKEQINFIQRLCLPLYETVADVFPQVKGCIETMRYNLSVWEERAAKWYAEDSQQESIWEAPQVKGNLDDLLQSKRVNKK